MFNSTFLHHFSKSLVCPQKFLVMFVILACLPTSPLAAQDDADKVKLREGLETLQMAVGALEHKHRVDAEICSKAVEWILRHDEFYKPNYVQAAQKTLQLGRDRAQQLITGQPNWGTRPGMHAVGYRSRIDESVQPYLLTLPEGFESGDPKRWPLYVVLHGRNATLTEASFIAGSIHKPAPKTQDWIQIDVFGRTNNAYRWAGETDVFEAIQDVTRRYKINENRITLWGFSMGGAGAWHLGLHHPSRWASVGAGAGFVNFYKYQKQTEQLPEHQHKALRIYDAEDYALNLNIVPFITYGGELDAQLVTSLEIQEQAKQLDVPLELIIGPQMGHKFDDASKTKFMEFLGQHNQQGRSRVPGKRDFRFITYTLKYNTCEWLTIQEQLIPYEKTTVVSTLDQDGMLLLTTANVGALSIERDAADQVRIDGSGPYDLNIASDANLSEVYFVKEQSSWQALNYEDSLEFEKNPERNKRHNLQGPIDDAFMEPFVCVQGTGDPWSPTLQRYADWSLERFSIEYDKWFRAKPVVRKDQDIDDRMIREKNLILFGDPGSNRVIRKVLEDLPLEWTKEKVVFGGKEYSTVDHALVMIFPNPLNPARYVVLNTGMTVHEKDFKASNAWLFPKLGDHAVIRFSADSKQGFDESVIEAGIFDANWNK